MSVKVLDEKKTEQDDQMRAEKTLSGKTGTTPMLTILWHVHRAEKDAAGF